MKKTRMLVFSGFLGSGKTTTMVETAKYLKDRGVKVALVTNDLGSNLVDTNYAKMEDFPVEEIPDGCFCHDVDHLTRSIDTLIRGESPDIVFAEPVGSCVDLVKGVYKVIDKEHSDRLELAPFTSVVDPFRYRVIYMDEGKNRFNPPVTYMFKKQLEEADILLLNKVDLLSEDEKKEILSSLRENFPHKKIIEISSIDQGNYEEWTSAILEGQGSGMIDLDIDWDYVVTAEDTMGWYNKEVHMESLQGKEINFNQVCGSILQKAKDVFASTDHEIAHLKIICTVHDEYCKAALTSVDKAPYFSQKISKAAVSALLYVNIRALMTPQCLQETMDEILYETAKEYNARLFKQKTQAFDSFAEAPEPTYVE